MADALKVVPETDKVKTGVRDIDSIAKALEGVLSDTYKMVFKTHAYHWNVEGPMFFGVHKLTEEQYEEMFAAADVLAERIRALGRMAPIGLQSMVDGSAIKDATKLPSAGEMCADLAQDHERLSQRLHALIQTAEKGNDPVTADLATARSAFHEQAAWMLRALSKS